MKYNVSRSAGDTYEEHSIEGTLTQVLVVLDALGFSEKGEIVPCSLDNTEQWEDGTLGADEEHAQLASEEATAAVGKVVEDAKKKIPNWALSADIDYSRIPLDWKHAWIAQDKDGCVFVYAQEPFVDEALCGWNYEAAPGEHYCKCLYVPDHACLFEDYKAHCFQYF